MLSLQRFRGSSRFSGTPCDVPHSPLICLVFGLVWNLRMGFPETVMFGCGLGEAQSTVNICKWIQGCWLEGKVTFQHTGPSSRHILCRQICQRTVNKHPRKHVKPRSGSGDKLWRSMWMVMRALAGHFFVALCPFLRLRTKFLHVSRLRHIT